MSHDIIDPLLLLQLSIKQHKQMEMKPPTYANIAREEVSSKCHTSNTMKFNTLFCILVHSKITCVTTYLIIFQSHLFHTSMATYISIIIYMYNTNNDIFLCKTLFVGTG